MDNIKSVVFSALPQTFEEFQALPQITMATPHDTAALCVAALCAYPNNKEGALQMLDYLRGPRPLSQFEKQFIADRFMDGKDYIPRSYFSGAVPTNDYTPAQPLTLLIGENPYSYQNEGYAKLLLKSGGADTPREIVLRLAKDGKWYLWDQFLLAGIREPESANPWA
ncbi:MAG: hypothetical protein IJI67_10040 [Clostridia bacterium]|nr:hypothetical protein [Clostridia bacterium]